MDNPEAEQLLILAQSHKGKAAEVIITKILNKPVYTFGEFLLVDSISAVSLLNLAWHRQ